MSEKKTIGQVDLLHGPILKNLMIFMIPIFISNAFQQLYNAVDTALVGNILGENSLAAIGATASIFELLVGFSMSLGTGFSIVIARAYGSKDSDRMKKAIAGSLVIGLGTIVLLTILSYFGLGPLLQLINTPDTIFEEALLYIRIIGLGTLVMFAYNLMSAILRAVGNSIMPLIFLIISSILNIILDYAFMKWFGMGVAGAAIATVIAQGVSVILCAVYIVMKQKELIPSRKDFVRDGDLYADLAGQGFSMAFMGSIVSVGSIILQSGINSLGTQIIAGHVAARKIFAIANLPFTSMAMAIATFIGQNRGANQGKRILTAMKDAYLFDAIGAAFVTALLWLTAPSLIHLITGSTNEVILQNGSMYLYVLGPFYAILGVLLQTRFALQGLGSKLIPLISSLIECIGKILFTIFLIPPFGYTAVIWCEPIIWCAMTLQLVYSFEKNPYIREIKAVE
jgi:putative MATE family efflux protein